MEIKNKQAKCVATLSWDQALFEMGWREEVAIKQRLSNSTFRLFTSNVTNQSKQITMSLKQKLLAKIKSVLSQVELDATDGCSLRICVHLSVLLGCPQCVLTKHIQLGAVLPARLERFSGVSILPARLKLLCSLAPDILTFNSSKKNQKPQTLSQLPNANSCFTSQSSQNMVLTVFITNSCTDLIFLVLPFYLQFLL